MEPDELDALPVIDKFSLIGGCVRLRMQVDPVRLASEVQALPNDLWGTRAGRGGVHDRAEAIFLRGYAPADRGMPMVERPPLELLPTVRAFLAEAIPASAMRCVLARLAPGGCIPAHADSGRYFERTVRLHVPVVTSPLVIMYAEGLCYRMKPGEVWALNNSGTHAVLNDDPGCTRIHLICDFAPTPALVKLISAGDAGLGIDDPGVRLRLERLFDAQAPASTMPQ